MNLARSAAALYLSGNSEVCQSDQAASVAAFGAEEHHFACAPTPSGQQTLIGCTSITCQAEGNVAPIRSYAELVPEPTLALAQAAALLVLGALVRCSVEVPVAARSGRTARSKTRFRLPRRPHGHIAAVLGILRKLGLDRLLAARRSPERDRAVAPIVSRVLAPDSKLAKDDGPLQLSLFDETELAEIEHPDFPGERLIACMNPLLAAERKREDLLQATEREFEKIAVVTRRKSRPLRGRDKIGLRVGKVQAPGLRCSLARTIPRAPPDSVSLL